ncbi:DUF4349 domain-containing protein [Streptomyces pristinaespiralis]|jgi:uncharacterized protein YfiM (DUF2279 family)|uniref:Lipoprotein n=2 Tax=Streptomyces pristinaespiralis TaxID=38300 RepID=A0A0M3QHP0_STRPR|nr:DUF4349 domain-containing protein [Streptomyces pristinaespiralis]ALC20089.1 lipoprotein [Streptomyces pristinaespiralis]QMU17002.1 DUF4349 domain-containing protein [Streptomyces pristinaespiralis]
MRARRAFAVLLLTASLGLAGCAGGSDSGDGAQSAAKPAARDAEGAAGSRQAADEAAGAPAEDGADRDGAAKPSAPPSTHVIRTATLEVEVEDATKALAAARRAAGNAGGHVENESTERIDDTHVTSNVVLRVPQERYESVLAELAGAGKLLSRTADAKDVTGQVVDVESRIATQRASVARVRELMDRATRLSDVVTLEAELSTRQADLESLLAQQATLKDRTSLATITLTLSETTPEETAKEDDGPGFLDALGGGWDALVATLHWIAVAVGAVAPFAALGAVLYAVWRWLVRPRLPERPARTPAPPAAPTAAAPAAARTTPPAAPGGTRD